MRGYNKQMKRDKDSRYIRHHAFVIEAEDDDGISVAHAWVEKELGMKLKANPDVAVLRYGLFSVEDARRVTELATGAPFAGEYKVVIIVASRIYHEAQNVLLKIFEEPPPGAFLFLIVPTLGGLLSTLRSRVHVLKMSDTSLHTSDVGHDMSYISDEAEMFIKATKEKRSAMIKKLTNGKDEEERRELRDEAIALINSIERLAYRSLTSVENTALLSDIAILRGYLYDRSAPVRMILEHLSLVVPNSLTIRKKV